MLARARYAVFDRLAKRRTLPKFEEAMRLQWESRDALEAIQRRKLEGILTHAYANTRYYRQLIGQAGIKSSEFSDPSSLAKIPVLTKSIIRGRRNDFEASDFDRYGPRTRATSGSTGESFHFVIDRETHGWVHAYLLLSWFTAGLDWGGRIVTLGGGNIKLSPLRRRVLSVLRNSVDIPAFDFDERRMTEVIVQLNRVRPAIVYGYGSALSLLAKFALDRKLALCSPRGIVTTAENLLPHNRERIEKAFGCKVFDQYGVMECGVTAFQCEKHAGYHLGMTKGLVEVVDDAGNAVWNKVGRIISTDLDNRAFPMIRYDTGDLGVMTRRACSCGRGFLLLERVIGRTREFLTAKDGTKVHGAVFSYLVRENPWINQYQVYQKTAGEIHVRIVSDDPIDAKREAGVRRFMIEKTGGGMDVLISRVSDIPVGPNQKRRFVISDIENI